MKDWLKQVFWGNTMQDYAVALGIIVGGIILLMIIKSIVLIRFRHFAQKTETDIDDFVLAIAQKAILPLCYAILIYFALKTLALSDKFAEVLHVALVVVFVFFVVRLLSHIIEYLLGKYLEREGRTKTNNALKGVMIIVKILLFTFGLIFLLDNLGYDVMTILTGLGIGGIAIALAAQNILGDIFAYFSILFDRPFEIGDFLLVEDKLGTVEHIGIKTTRINSLSGEQLIYSNKQLTDSWIHNYARMEKRRAVFGFNIPYDTPVDKIEAIPGLIKDIVSSKENVKFDRAHFASFKESYLYFEAVYYSLSPDYTVYMNVQQAINLEIMRTFEKMGVAFAFPTKSVWLHQEKNGSNNSENK